MDLAIRITVFLIGTLACLTVILCSILVLITPEHKVLYWLKWLAGAYGKHPQYSEKYYNFTSRLMIKAVIVQFVVIDIMLYLALFNHPLFVRITGGH